jgi:hypothetical protein
MVGQILSNNNESAIEIFPNFFCNLNTAKDIDRAYSSQPLHWPGGAQALLPT